MIDNAIITGRWCLSALQQLRSVRRCLSRHALLALIRALVVSKVDNFCSMLAGVSGHLLRQTLVSPAALYSPTSVLSETFRTHHIASLLIACHGADTVPPLYSDVPPSSLFSHTHCFGRPTINLGRLVADPRAWNSLLSSVPAATSLISSDKS